VEGLREQHGEQGAVRTRRRRVPPVHIGRYAEDVRRGRVERRVARSHVVPRGSARRAYHGEVRDPAEVERLPADRIAVPLGRIVA
jgi:hypothetical protein